MKNICIFWDLKFWIQVSYVNLEYRDASYRTSKGKEAERLGYVI